MKDYEIPINEKVEIIARYGRLCEICWFRSNCCSTTINGAVCLPCMDSDPEHYLYTNKIDDLFNEIAPDNKIQDGYYRDNKTGLFLVYVDGNLRAAAKDQTEAAYLYKKVR